MAGLLPFSHLATTGIKAKMLEKLACCGGTGTEITVPTNTVQVPITTGTVMDSGSECTGFIGW